MSCQDQPSSRAVCTSSDVQPLGEGSQGRDRAEPDIGVVTRGALGLTRTCGLRVRNT